MNNIQYKMNMSRIYCRDKVLSDKIFALLRIRTTPGI